MTKLILSFLFGCACGYGAFIIWFMLMMRDEINQTSPYNPKMPKGNTLHPARGGKIESI